MKTALIILTVFFLNIQFVIAQNNCLQFDGNNDYVSISDLYLSGYSAFTVETWVYLKTFNENAGDDKISNIVRGGDECIVLRIGDSGIENDRPQFVVDFGSGQIKLNANTQLKADHWYHLAGVYDGSTMKLYINGILDNSVSQSGTVKTTSEMTILGGSNTETRLIDGYIDDTKLWNDARTESEIRQNMHRELTDPSSEVNLVAYYKYNESSGTTLTDAKGSYNGSLTNMTGSEWKTSSAMFGPKNCLIFDGIDDFVTTGAALVNLSNNMTVEAWFNTTNSTHYNSIATIEKTAAGSNDFLQILTNSSGNIYLDDANNAQIITTSESYNDGNWHHVAFVRNAAIKTIYLYVDGDLKGTRTYTYSGSIDPDMELRFGNSEYLGGSYQMDGMLDEIRIWDDVRTITEIRDNMCKTLTGSESNLVGYYTFDNTSGTTLQDFTGNGNDGTLTNMADEDWVVSYSMVLAKDASDVAGTSFTVNWDSPGTNSSYDDGYTIQYSTTSNFSSNNSTTTALSSETSKSLTGLTESTTYYYRVSGKRSGSATLEYSNIKNATTSEPSFSTIVTSNADDNGIHTLRYIMNNCDDGAEITFNLSEGNETISLGSEINFTASKSITIDGDNSLGSGTDVTIQVTIPGEGGSNWRVFQLNPGPSYTLVLKNMTVKGGDLGGGSAGSIYLYNAQLTTLENVTVSGSKADMGGGIYVFNTPTILNNCTIQDTKATTSGGGFFCPTYDLSVTINNTLISNCFASQGGGAYLASNNCNISNLEIDNCSADNSGGGIYCYSLFGSLNGLKLTNNSALNGGAIYAEDGCSFSFDKCEFSNNVARNVGGAFYFYASADIYSAFNNCTFSNNSSTLSGGAIYAFSTVDWMFGDPYTLDLILNNCTIVGNSSGNHGAGIYATNDNDSYTNVSLTNSLVAYNAFGSVYDDLTNVGATLYGNYNIIGEFTLSGTNNTNYTYTNGLGSSLFESYTEIIGNSIYQPDLADNGGTNKTVALATNSIAQTSGIRTGSYTDTYKKYAFYNGTNWVKVEDGTTVVSSGVTAITTDQRGTDRNSLTPSIGAYDNSNSAVPVELVSFSAVTDDENTTLSWQTATEINNYGFEIEKANNVEDPSWQKIGFVEGFGNSNSTKMYSFADNNLSTGKYLYRLKQIDNDGQYKYSESIEVDFNALPVEFSLWQNYPNPFNPTTNITYSLPSSQFVTLKIFTLLGEEIATLVNEPKEAGSHTINFDASKLTSGIYLYQIQAGQFNQVRKMLLLK